MTGSAETDTDGDGLPDTYEVLYDLDVLVPDSLADLDGDGASNLQEYQQGTHPRGYYKRYLAEGATGSFLDTRISAANAGTVPATALLRFQPDAGPNQVQRFTIPGRERRFTYPRWLPSLASVNFSTVVESNTEISVDRSMFCRAFISTARTRRRASPHRRRRGTWRKGRRVSPSTSST